MSKALITSGRNLSLVATIILTACFSASAEPPSVKNINEVSNLTLDSIALILIKEDAAGARGECVKAQNLARKFDLDPYIAALIDVCFSRVAEFQKNKPVACRHVKSALQNYAATPATHPSQRVLQGQIKGAKELQAKLGC
jgi:hypothetical protein